MGFMWGYQDHVIEKKEEYLATKQVSRAHRGLRNKDSKLFLI